MLEQRTEDIQDLQHRLAGMQSRIQKAAKDAGRNPNEIILLPVSKSKPASMIRAAAALGLDCVGENYVPEAMDKLTRLTDLDLKWHFIGAVQANKTATLAAHFDWVQSIDRFKVARRLSGQRPAQLPPLNVCVQVNLDLESQKAGVVPDQAMALCRQIVDLPGLRLRGLMAIPKPSSHEHERHRAFTALAQLKSEIGTTLGLADFDTLSMGMSGDFEAAIACGSTLVRIGTALFGPRSMAVDASG